MDGKLGAVDDYMARAQRGQLEHSPAQLEVLTRFERVARDLAEAQGTRRGWFGSFGRKAAEPVRGLYVHGGVGRGKTMLMDLFYKHVPVARKRRTHFHEFMSDVHERVTAARKVHAGDPIPIVAAQIIEEAELLCFDELHVTDIADAMILGRLFEAIFAGGVVLVATSNVAPRDLYKNGLNRDLFLPFVDMIEARLEVLPFPDGQDYRLRQLAGRPLYFTPVDAAAKAAMDELWDEFTENADPVRGVVHSLGRAIPVPAMADGVARFDFDDLCRTPLGPRDYLVIARRFNTLLIDGIPKLGAGERNEARRLINLVDTLYDNFVCLIASAEAEPRDLYRAGDGVDLFQRTASRLSEMRTEAYLQARERRVEAIMTSRAPNGNGT